MSLRRGHRLMCRPSRTKAVAVGGEGRVESRLEHLQYRLLDEPVEHRGNAKFPHPAVWLRYLNASHRRRRIRAAQQLVPMCRPVRSQVIRQLVDGPAVDARTALVRLDAP